VTGCQKSQHGLAQGALAVPIWQQWASKF